MAKRRPSGDGMVRKKEDGRWEGRIVVGHKANGAPIFRYVYGRTQKELLSKLHQNIETYQDVELTEDGRMTLGEWLDRWLDEYKSGTIRSSTMYGYRQYARLYIKPILGDKVISRITSTDIQRMYTKLKREGRVHEHPEYGHQLSDALPHPRHAPPRYERCPERAPDRQESDGGHSGPQAQLSSKANLERGAVGHFYDRDRTG